MKENGTADPRKDKLLTLARDLQRRRARERGGLFVAEGIRAVEELLASPLVVRGALIAPMLQATERGAALAGALRARGGERGVAVASVTESELQSASDTDTPQGVLAIAEIPERSFGDQYHIREGYRLLVLDGVQDPGNVGTILRTAAALGVDETVALPGTADLWNAKVVRGAMGAHFRHRAFPATFEEMTAHLAQHGIPLWATSADGEPLDMISAPGEQGRLALVVGNEGAGVTPRVRAVAARTVALPIAGVESLNVAVATGILLYALRLPTVAPGTPSA